MVLDRVLEGAGLTRADLAGDAPRVVASAYEGRVRDLFFEGVPGLSTLAWVGELDGLEELRVVGATLPELDGLSGACALRRARLARNGVADLSALAACEQLEALWIVEESVTSLESLPALPSLRELYVDHTALTDLGGIAGREALERLVVTHAGLRSVEGIERLPALRALDVSHNRLATFAGLGTLPRLATIHASHNELTDAAPLDDQPSLVEVDLRHNRLDDFPAAALTGDAPKITDNPGGEAYFAAQAQAETDARRLAREREQPDGTIPELPQRRGSTRSVRRSLTWSGRSVTGHGSIGRFEGMPFVELLELDPANVIDPHKNADSVRLTATVESGAVRLIFAERDSGYAYTELGPGEPAIVRTRLYETSFGIGFFAQALDGSAEGLRFELEPDR